ncbi:FRG domain-containing protein [Prolixibacteraceae bacterium Z1-6]|uniref:FRG domain-containing protein n=1 Tax=Draconibacterium aestuarii TaxID=2998507 RepID=A0A9X3FB03_9BACT|nr:FRG domain-containing protein [Prolixibacteraceae bacterium Z1-6]
MWQEIEIKNWDHFNQYVTKLKPKNWVFRGQSNVNWKLETSYYRALQFIKGIKSTVRSRSRDTYEEEIINQFKSQYHLYLSYCPDDIAELILDPASNNDKAKQVDRKLEWLSIMQHHGVPTRLLDWTFSPFVALFFALEFATSTCCVYALNQSKLQKMDRDNLEPNYKAELFSNSKGEKSFLRPYEPKIKNERLVKQQGLFLVPSTNFETFDEILSLYHNFNNYAYKLIINEKLRYDFHIMLRRQNITHESLFPGIDGFCRSLKFSLLESANYLKRLS